LLPGILAAAAGWPNMVELDLGLGLPAEEEEEEVQPYHRWWQAPPEQEQEQEEEVVAAAAPELALVQYTAEPVK
jgi:hypothetical protein